jgi:hypothetical protein
MNANKNEGDSYVRRDAKAFAGSDEGRGRTRSPFRRALAVRGASSDAGGSGAPAAKLLLLACLTLLASLALGVAAVSAAAPVVTMGAVSSPGYTTVHASGEVDPEGEPTEWFFEVSTDGINWERKNVYGFGSDSTPQTLSGTIEGLQPSTTYRVRIGAYNFNENALTVSPEPSPEATTLGPVAKPTVTIDPVTVFTDSTAHFKGEIDPGAAQSDPGFNVNWHFECEPACSSLSNGGGSFADDGVKHTVETDAAIEPSTEYTIKLVAENVGGPASDQTTFQSSTSAPRAETIPAFPIGGGTEALIGGKVNPRNSPTTYWLEYGAGPGGPGATYSSVVPAKPGVSVGSGSQFVFATQKISGLTPGSTYHFRIVAENSTGTTQGEDLSFETLAPSSPPSSCPNEKLRSETNSAALAECRAYELTTEPDKNGNDIFAALDSNLDGSRLAYTAFGGFGNTESNSALVTYLAQRSATGWTTTGMQPKTGVPDLGFNGNFYPSDFTKDLSKAVSFGTAAVASEPGIRNILVKDADGTTVWVTKPTVEGAPILHKNYAGRTADASHILFESAQPFTAQGNGAVQIWEWIEGQVRLVSIMPNGEVPAAGAAVGNGINGAITEGTGFSGVFPQPTVISEDGSRIFFGLGGGGGFSYGVYVRENGTETRRIDVSQRAGSIGAEGGGQFVGAAGDGSIVVFTSFTQLTDDATPNGGLYAYNLETEKLRFLSAGATDPAGAQFAGTTFISHDASHVYFVAGSVLVPGKGVAGGRNFYVADPDGVRFIATLASDDSLDRMGGSPSGRYFVFQSYERLTSFDNDGHSEVYRYDADQEALVCVSCGTEAAPASGEASVRAYPAPRGVPEEFGQAYRAGVISDDGSRVLFETTQALVPGDVNGLGDVYEYHEGQLHLISTGTSKFPSDVAGITHDGGSIFFLTRDSLVGQDIDGGSRDIYVARINGGFPAPTTANPCESAEACQHAPSAAPAFVAPTTTAPSRGNVTHHRKKQKKCRGKAKKRHGKCVSKGKKHHKKQGKNASKSGRGN